MAKITLNPLSGSYASVTAINARLQQIEDAFNDNVVWRDGFTTEPNEMNADLDMNGFDILNVTAFTETYVYYGGFADAPTTNSVGDPLGAGDAGNMYFNTTSNVTFVWDGGVWTAIGTAQNSAGSVILVDAPANFDSPGNVEAAFEQLFDGTSTDNATKSGAETLTNKTIESPVLDVGVSGTAVDTDVTMAADSDTLLASQKAIKGYIDNIVPTSGNKYLIESRYCAGTHTQEFPSVFGNIPGVAFHKYIIEFEDINFSHDSQEFAFQLTYNNGTSYSATNYRPEQNSYIYHSIIKDADYIFYTGCAGLDGEMIINGSGISSYTRMETKVNYPHYVVGAPNQYNKFHQRGHSHDTTGTPTGFRVFQDTGAGPGINPIGTFTGYIKVYGIIA